MAKTTSVTVNHVLQALGRIKDPANGRSIVDADWIGDIQINAGRVSFTIFLPKSTSFPEQELKSACVGAVKQIPEVIAVLPNISHKAKPQSPNKVDALANIGNIIAIGSGKGGVGKSTTAVNLAIALAKKGFRVGLLDADIYGPCVPAMMAKELPEGDLRDHIEMDGDNLVPLELFGIKVMSVAMLIEEGQPTVWRAPIATKMINQFVSGVSWGDLDYLLLDLPPGTGDIQLTLSQLANLSGAVIVTTPQKVALEIARKGLHMFERVNVPILGVVETMSGFACAHCDEVTPIFGEGGASYLAETTNTTLLGQIPLDVELMRSGDSGDPVVNSNPDSSAAKAYMELASKFAGILQAKGQVSEIVPVGIAGVPDESEEHNHAVSIFWSDGQKRQHRARALRAACPCAVCVDEMSGVRKVFEKDVATDVHLLEAKPVGRYGVNLSFSDKHSTGIYTYDYLRELQAEVSQEAPPAH